MDPFSADRATWKQCADALRELAHVALVQLLTTLCFALLPLAAKLLIRQAFGFRLGKGSFFNQQSLSLITPTGTAEFQDHRR